VKSPGGEGCSKLCRKEETLEDSLTIIPRMVRCSRVPLTHVASYAHLWNPRRKIRPPAASGEFK
jgi:hypothetical protein